MSMWFHTAGVRTEIHVKEEERIWKVDNNFLDKHYSGCDERKKKQRNDLLEIITGTKRDNTSGIYSRRMV